MNPLPEDWHAVVVSPDRRGWPVFLDWLEEQNDRQRLFGYRALKERRLAALSYPMEIQ